MSLPEGIIHIHCRFQLSDFPPPRAANDFPLTLENGKHLFPFRTEPLSRSSPMVLGGQLPGRVGR